MVQLRQLRSASPPPLADLRPAVDEFDTALRLAAETRRKERRPIDWFGHPYPSTFWAWWDQTVARLAVDRWVARGGHGEEERHAGRWLLASPKSMIDVEFRRPNPGAYSVAFVECLQLLEDWRRFGARLQDIKVWVNLHWQWGKQQAVKGERWRQLITRAYQPLSGSRRQLYVWGRVQAHHRLSRASR